MLFAPNPGILAAGVSSYDPYGGAQIVLDFAGVKNGGAPFYRRDGVSYASASGAGFTGSGTFDASGYTATGTQSISGPVSLLDDFIILSDFIDPMTSGTKRLWQAPPGSQLFHVSRGNANYSTQPGTGLGPSSASRIAMGRSVGKARISYDGLPTMVGVDTFPANSSTLYIGNQDTGTTPWTGPIRLVEVHIGTKTDAEIQSLCLY